VCDVGEACNSQTGECETDPCLGVVCPTDEQCVAGSCYDPGSLIPTPDAGPDDLVYAGGGGCRAAGGSHGHATSGLLVLLALALLRRRRRLVRGLR